MNERLHQISSKFFKEEFDAPYRQLHRKDQTIRHIGQHIAKAGLKLSEFLDTTIDEDHSQLVHTGRQLPTVSTMLEEVAPDLILYRYMLMDTLNLTDADVPRRPALTRLHRLEPRITRVNGMFGHYLEPLEHREDAPADQRLPRTEFDVERARHALTPAATELQVIARSLVRHYSEESELEHLVEARACNKSY